MSIEYSTKVEGRSISSCAFDADGRLLAVCGTSGEVLRFDPGSREFTSYFFSEVAPVGMALAHGSNEILLASRENQCIVRGKLPNPTLSPYLARFEGRSLLGPTAIALSPIDSEIFFTDGGCEGDSSIFNPCGGLYRTVQGRTQLVSLVTTGLQKPSGLAFDKEGRLYVCEQSANRMIRFISRGSYYVSSIFAQFHGSLGPQAVAINNFLKRIYVALYEPCPSKNSGDADALPKGRIVVLNFEGEVLETLFTPPGMSQLNALAVDPQEQHLFAVHVDDEESNSTVFCFGFPFAS